MKDSQILLIVFNVLPIVGLCWAYNDEQVVARQDIKPIVHNLEASQEAASTQPMEVSPAPVLLYRDPLLKAVIQVESGGNPNAVSSKGARGLGQAMPETAKDPGYGVKQMHDHSVKEQLRFAGDYLNAMRRRYGNAKLALAAYNAGPGAVDKVLAKMPKETQRYVQKVAKQYAENEEQP